MTLTAFIAVALLHLMAAISPGPAVLLSARTGLTGGMRAGMLVAAGIGLGAVIWASAALFGLALVFEAAPAALWSLKIVGGAYLVWLGWRSWRDAGEPLSLTAAKEPRRAELSPFRLGLLTQLANPKPAIMFSAIFVGAVPPGTSGWVIVLLLGVVFLNEAVWNAMVARFFALDRARKGYAGLKTLIDRGFGAVLMLIGLKMAFSRA